MHSTAGAGAPFPKGTSLTRVTAEQVRQDRLNRRPRKVLGCLTPFEVFTKSCPRPDSLAGPVPGCARYQQAMMHASAGPAPALAVPDCIACSAGKSRLSPLRH